MSESSQKDLEWNIGKHRIEQVGELTGKVRERHQEALKYPTAGRLKNYRDSLEALFFDIRAYIEDEELKQQFEGLLEDVDDLDSAEKKLEKLKKLDRKLQEKRLDLGLDIPSKTSPDSILD